ncbi:MAG: hypothetical protein JST26_08120 [Bacteroidetes bacterium]|nr:hypothetical protein [Bacteroidota bacterium]
MSSNYSKIRFIGYAIPTTPGNLIPIGNPNGPGAVAGTYLGNPDVETDINNRILVLKNAVDLAKNALPKNEDPTSIINLFVAPEFYFHGVDGPYVYSTTGTDPADMVIQKLQSTFPASDYPNWTFVFGSAITAKVDNLQNVYDSNYATIRNSVVHNLSKNWQDAYGPLQDVIFDMLVNFIKNCHSYPNMEVRNRAMIVSNIALSSSATNEPFVGSGMTTEKYFVSNEDFLLYEASSPPKQVVTEQMTAYPVIDLSGGDLKRSNHDKFSVFRQNYGSGNFPAYMDFGIEICLDHSDVRLRRNINNEPWSNPAVDAIHVQIIPSCGMQISAPSVAADKNGFVFNCDGQYNLDTTTTPQANAQSGVNCAYVNYIQNSNYAAHTQLATVLQPATGPNPALNGSNNATFNTLTTNDVVSIPVTTTPLGQNFNSYFAGGPGEVHIYGVQNGYVLYP